MEWHQGVSKYIVILFKCHHSRLYLFKMNLSYVMQCGIVFGEMFIFFAQTFFLRIE